MPVGVSLDCLDLVLRGDATSLAVAISGCASQRAICLVVGGVVLGLQTDDQFNFPPTFNSRRVSDLQPKRACRVHRVHLTVDNSFIGVVLSLLALYCQQSTDTILDDCR